MASATFDQFNPEAETSPRRKPSFGASSVSTRLKVNCGCGASFNTLSDGEDHSSLRGHTLTITGEIRAER